MSANISKQEPGTPSKENAVSYVLSTMSNKDLSERQKEMEYLKKKLEECNLRLHNHLINNEDTVKETIYVYIKLAERVKEAKSKISALKQRLLNCKQSLILNYPDLKANYNVALTNGFTLEYLNRIDQILTVPVRVDNFLSQNNYLSAATALTEALGDFSGDDLSSIPALSTLSIDLSAKFNKFNDVLLDKLFELIFNPENCLFMASSSNGSNGASQNISSLNVEITSANFSYSAMMKEKNAEMLINMILNKSRENLTEILNSFTVIKKLPDALAHFTSNIYNNLNQILINLIYKDSSIDVHTSTITDQQSRSSDASIEAGGKKFNYLIKNEFMHTNENVIENSESFTDKQVKIFDRILCQLLTKVGIVTKLARHFFAAVESESFKFPDELAKYSCSSHCETFNMQVHSFLQNIFTFVSKTRFGDRDKFAQAAAAQVSDPNNPVSPTAANNTSSSTSAEGCIRNIFKPKRPFTQKVSQSLFKISNDYQPTNLFFTKSIEVNKSMSDDRNSAQKQTGGNSKNYANFLSFIKPSYYFIPNEYVKILDFINTCELDKDNERNVIIYIRNYLENVYLPHVKFAAVVPSLDKVLSDNSVFISKIISRSIDEIVLEECFCLIKECTLLPDYSGKIIKFINDRLKFLLNCCEKLWTNEISTCNLENSDMFEVPSLSLESINNTANSDDKGEKKVHIESYLLTADNFAELEKLILANTHTSIEHEMSMIAEEDEEDEVLLVNNEDDSQKKKNLSNDSLQQARASQKSANAIVKTLKKMSTITINNNNLRGKYAREASFKYLCKKGYIELPETDNTKEIKNNKTYLTTRNSSTTIKVICALLVTLHELQSSLKNNLVSYIMFLSNQYEDGDFINMLQSSKNNEHNVNPTDRVKRMIKSSSRAELANLHTIIGDMKKLSDKLMIMLNLELRLKLLKIVSELGEQNYYMFASHPVADDLVVKATKFILDYYDICYIYMNNEQMEVLFGGFSNFISDIFINMAGRIKRINQAGLDQMVHNILTLKRNLSRCRFLGENLMDRCASYYDLMNTTPNELMDTLHEQGPVFLKSDYREMLRLMSTFMGSKEGLQQRLDQVEAIFARR